MKISTLASSRYITDKHWDYRNENSIKYIIPHHMAGKLSGAGCAQYFCNNGLENSANYCIGYDGDISCCVPEEYGAWTSSFGIADKQAITMEISDTAYGDWTIPGPAQEAFIRLCVDLFKRYPSLGGKAVYDPDDAADVAYAKKTQSYFTTKGNILLHQWTSNNGTTCPEWHMKQILPKLVEEINRRLAGDDPEPEGEFSVKEWQKAAKEDGLYTGEIDGLFGPLSTAAANVGTYMGCRYRNIVKFWQRWLKDKGYYEGDVDGSFGPQTRTAVYNAQGEYGLTQDACIGPASTRAFLEI